MTKHVLKPIIVTIGHFGNAIVFLGKKDVNGKSCITHFILFGNLFLDYRMLINLPLGLCYMYLPINCKHFQMYFNHTADTWLHTESGYPPVLGVLCPGFESCCAASPQSRRPRRRWPDTGPSEEETCSAAAESCSDRSSLTQTPSRPRVLLGGHRQTYLVDSLQDMFYR